MEFKRDDAFSKFEESGYSLLISSEEISEMLRNEYLHDLHSHFIVTFDGNYEDSRFFHFGLIPERIKQLEKAFNQGQTIVIKELENWNERIKNRCAEFIHSTNVHMYLTPPKGTGFGWHTDDRHVFIFMQKGEKVFEVEEPDQTISKYLLKEGSRLFIPYGAKHRAIATDVACVHLGFGVWPEGMTILDKYQSFPLSIEINI